MTVLTASTKHIAYIELRLPVRDGTASSTATASAKQIALYSHTAVKKNYVIDRKQYLLM